MGVEPQLQVIGTRHGEKLYETLATREELRRAEDQGDYFRVRVDARDLNYSEYFEEGDRRESQIDDYHSHNTERLDVDGVVTLLEKLPQFRALMDDTTTSSRVLAVHRYYWPDTPPYASMLRTIAAEWTRAGHTVDVLTSQPSYKPEANIAKRPATERVDDVRVRRIAMEADRSASWRRPFNVIWFPLVVAWRILIGPRYDVVMCSTAPPVSLGWAVSFAARVRGARFVYHCMDLHPEIGRLSGEFSHPLVYRVMHRLELATCRRAAAIVVLSEDMRDAVIARDPALAPRIVILTNFELPDFDTAGAVASPLPADPTRMRIVFTGNVGRFQNLDVITRAVLAPDPELDALELVFMGEGAAKAELQCDRRPGARRACRDRVRFLDHGSPAAVRALLATADLGLVSLTPEVIKFAYPSKTATYLGAGLPVLVAVETDSSLVRLVEADPDRWAPPRGRPARDRPGAGLLGEPQGGARRHVRPGRDRVAGGVRHGAVAPAMGSPAGGGRPRRRRPRGVPMSTDRDVVIIGAPRSGTNMLRDVLTSLPGFATWPCDEINLIWRHGNRDLPLRRAGAGAGDPQGRGVHPGPLRRDPPALRRPLGRGEDLCELPARGVRARGRARGPVHLHHPGRARRHRLRDRALARPAGRALHGGEGAVRPAERPGRTTEGGSSPDGSGATARTRAG